MEYVIKQGVELYHASGEPFKEEELRHGGFDGILWTTDSSAIAQTYIPVAGGTLYTNSKYLIAPSQIESITDFQKKKLGIEYSNVTFERGRAQSWREVRMPIERKENEGYYDFEKRLLDHINSTMENMGYKPSKNSYGNDKSWELKQNGNKIMPADYRKRGRLFILSPKRDLKLFDMTAGEELEHDLTDKQYLELSKFERIKRAGYDGVKINDFAQSEEYGNLQHISFGIFPHAIKELDKRVIGGAKHPDYLETIMKSGDRDWRSKEHKAHLGIAESIIRHMIRKFLLDN